MRLGRRAVCSQYVEKIEQKRRDGSAKHPPVKEVPLIEFPGRCHLNSIDVWMRPIARHSSAASPSLESPRSGVDAIQSLS